ncbi:MAG TPA: biopolymer transporter ExbD [Thermoanaerobaculia bacterium]|nr:biopolymer transporter ExbD [Thermoanaerobaculia bacterium]
MAFGAGGGSPDEVKGDINVTPLVDVCLVLLIIFMVVTPMLQQGVDVQLPQAPHAEQKPGEQGDLVMSIKQDGTVFVGDTWIPDRNLVAYLTAERQRDPNRAVMLKADSRLNFGKVRELMQKANEAEWSSIAILTEKQIAGERMAAGHL